MHINYYYMPPKQPIRSDRVYKFAISHFGIYQSFNFDIHNSYNIHNDTV